MLANTSIPALLQDRLSQLNVPDSTCRWIIDFLSVLRLCSFSLFFSQYTNSCTSCHESVKVLKFANDTTLIGLISDGDESAYMWEIDHLVTWCNQHNLELNAVKTVEMVIDFRKNPAPPAPIILRNSPVEPVDSVRFLGTIIT